MDLNYILAASILLSTLIASYVYININRYEVSHLGALYIDHWDQKICKVRSEGNLQSRLRGYETSKSLFYHCISIASKDALDYADLHANEEND